MDRKWMFGAAEPRVLPDAWNVEFGETELHPHTFGGIFVVRLQLIS